MYAMHAMYALYTNWLEFKEKIIEKLYRVTRFIRRFFDQIDISTYRIDTICRLVKNVANICYILHVLPILYL